MPMLINAYCTIRDLPELQFSHEPKGRRDLGDPELSKHLDGFIGYALNRGDKKMTSAKYHVMRHLQRVAHHLSLAVDEPAMDAFSAWAWQANTICFLPDSTIRDPNGQVLIPPDGGAQDAGAEVPYPPDARARKAATDRALQERGVLVPAHLPPVIAETEVAIRSPVEAARRALALFAVALRAESLAAQKEIPMAEIERRLPLGVQFLSPKETAFFRAASPEKQQLVDFCWRYEALNLLLWTLGRVPELAFPSGICDVPALAQIMVGVNEPEFVAGAGLRPAGAILDALDLQFRCHWATRQARLDGKRAAGLEGGVVQERHHALNWLIRFENAEWDAVDTPT